MRAKTSCIICFLMIALYACKEAFNPKPTSTNYGYLVVEGLINIADSSYFTLSRTVTVTSSSATKPELKAIVTIEDATGKSYPVTEIGKGVYGAPNYNLSATGQYRIRIQATNRETYLSDLVAATITPPIDSLVWKDMGNGVRISINTHDDKGITKYYRWDYTETWEIHTAHISNLVYQKPIGLVLRTPALESNLCWQYAGNPDILLASTATLTKSVIPDLQLEFIPKGNEKLSFRYSTIVREYALSKDAYDYYSLLKKNTEELGSIFDAQPSASIGNIHCLTTPSEPVLGYISAGTVSTSKRIFIGVGTELPIDYLNQYFLTSPYYDPSYCKLVNADGAIFAQVPVVIAPFSTTQGYEPAGCADCTVNGGVNVKPYFW